MKLSLFLASLAVASGVAIAAGPQGTTTVIINGEEHVYDSTVSGVGADTALLAKQKTRDAATPANPADLSKYKMGADGSSPSSTANIISQGWSKGTAPSTAGMSAEAQATASKYYGSSANKTTLENGSIAPSSTAMQSYTQGLLGVAGVEGTAGPINKNGGAGAATFKSAQESTFRCGTNKDFAVNGWTGKLTCNGTTSVTVQVCPHPPGTVFCEKEEELKTFTLAAGGQTQEASLGLTMQASFPDKDSVKLKFSTKATAAAVVQTAPQRAEANAASGGGTTGAGNGNSTLGMLNKVTNSTNYAKALEGPGASVATCQEKAERGETCDGDVVDVGWVKQDGTVPAECEKDICLNQATTKTDWTESCTRSFTLTNYACAFVRAPVSCVTIAKTAPVTYTCESSGCQKVTAAEVEDYFGGVSGCVHDTSGDSCYTVGTITRCDQRWVCSAGTVSRTCDGGVNPTPAKGYILTGTTTKQVQANGGTQNQLIESWLGPDLATNNCAATPYPLSGPVSTSCENGGVGKKRGPCEAWYGRTLTASACTMTNPLGGTADVDESMKKGCGYCARYSMLDTCSALAPVASADCPAASKPECVQTSTRCVSASPQGTTDQCYAQEESYQCSKSSTSCTTWGKPASCNVAPSQGVTAGIPSTPRDASPSSNLSQAIVGLALLDASAKSANNCKIGESGCISDPAAAKPGIEASDSEKRPLEAEATKDDEAWYAAHGGLPRIFNGVAQECVNTLNNVAINCCDPNLSAPTSQCPEPYVQLAKARRSGFAHLVESNYCKDEKCGTRADLYCTFEGLLPRVVQEQGRKQIDQAQAAYQGADTTAFTSTLSYYGAADKGNWAWHQSKDGLHVYQWAWPSWCSDPVVAQAKLKADATAISCPPVPEMWFATCAESTSAGATPRCTTPPTSPFEVKAGFSVVRADPLADTITPIHRQAWVKGACDTATATCSYQVSMTTAGNRVVLSRESNFMSTTGAPADSASASFEMGPLSVIGKTMLRPVIWAMEGAGPSEITVQYSTDEGGTWTAVKVPAQGQGKATRLAGAEAVDLAIDCNNGGGANVPMPCVLKASGTVVLTSKPWSVGKGIADCSGFTPSQFSLLDYDRMDLSEWLSTNPGNLSVADTSQLPAALGAQVKSMTDSYYAKPASDAVTLGGTVSVSPERAQSIFVSPDSGFGPFTVKLLVSGNWPQLYEDETKNTNPVRSVMIDWGDGSPLDNSATAQISGGKVTNFAAQHEFKAPTQGDLLHTVKVTVTAANGTYTVTKSVKNSWQKATTTSQNTGATSMVAGQVSPGAATAATVPGAAVLKNSTNP